MQLIGVPRVSIPTLLAIFALPLLYILLPTMVGLNGDLKRYGEAGLSLLCSDGGAIWANYKSEPLFVAILWFFAEVWSVLFSSDQADYCLNPGFNVFWLPIFVSTIFILLLIYIVRPLRGAAIYFHLVFCLDTALLMLPFNLLRQFIAMVIVVALVSLLIRERISPLTFIAALVVPALIHWSVWFLFLTGLAATIPSLFLIAARLSKRTVAAWAGVVGLVLLGVFLGPALYNLFSEKLMSRLDVSLSINGLLHPVTFFVAVFSYAISRHLKQEFACRFIVCTTILYVVITLTGNSLIIERMRTLLVPTAYFAFLYIRATRPLAPAWSAVNVLFVLFALTSFLWNAIVAQPFAERDSFMQLLS